MHANFCTLSQILRESEIACCHSSPNSHIFPALSVLLAAETRLLLPIRRFMRYRWNGTSIFTLFFFFFLLTGVSKMPKPSLTLCLFMLLFHQFQSLNIYMFVYSFEFCEKFLQSVICFWIYCTHFKKWISVSILQLFY